MNDLERRFSVQKQAGLAIETRAEGKPVVSGYAAVFFNASDLDNTQYRLWDDYFERIMPGAFDRALREDDVRCLFNHDDRLILGRTAAGTCSLSIDGKGLRYDCQLPDTSCGRDVAESLRRGDITGSSFGFRATKVQWRQEEDITFREVLEVQLFDVSPVTFPAYSGSTADVAKRSLERWQAENEPDRLARSIRRRRLLQKGPL